MGDNVTIKSNNPSSLASSSSSATATTVPAAATATAAVATSHGEPVMKGWLFKWTNYLKGYQRRWFVLKNGQLSYYRWVGYLLIILLQFHVCVNVRVLV